MQIPPLAQASAPRGSVSGFRRVRPKALRRVTPRAYWENTDLVMEVVSDDDRRRDVETKRLEYARAGIPEYWIVDPSQGRITVLRLSGEHYITHDEYARGTRAVSAQLPSFGVEVTEVLSGE